MNTFEQDQLQFSNQTSSQDPYWLEQLENDYGYAILHIVILRIQKPNQGEDQYVLLFGLVELVPKEIPKLITMTYPLKNKVRISGDPDCYIYVLRVTCTVREAREWYISYLKGEPSKVPWDDPKSPTPEVYHLDPEPPWPHLVCADDDSLIPFKASWHMSPQIHQLVSLSFSIIDYFSKEEDRKKVENFVFEHLHFDISLFPSLWGSINLLLPNPMFREFQYSLKPSQNTLESTLLCHLIPRIDQKMENLTLRIEEERPSGRKELLYKIPIDSPFEIKIPYELKGRCMKIFHDSRGLLYSEGIHHPFEELAIKINIIQGQRFTQIGNEEIQIPLIGKSSLDDLQKNDLSISTTNHPSAYLKLYQNQIEYRTAQNGKSLGQKSLSDQAEAQKTIFELLQKATTKILIVDPYLSHKEFSFVLSCLSDLTVPVRMLTSAEHLRSHTESRSEHCEQLANEDALARKSNHLNPYQIKVLEGEKSPIHARFLCIDETIWLIDNSLNGLGITLSVISTLSNSKPIFLILEEHWKKAKCFSDWIEERRKKRNQMQKTCQNRCTIHCKTKSQP